MFLIVSVCLCDTPSSSEGGFSSQEEQDSSARHVHTDNCIDTRLKCNQEYHEHTGARWVKYNLCEICQSGDPTHVESESCYQYIALDDEHIHGDECIEYYCREGYPYP